MDKFELPADAAFWHPKIAMLYRYWRSIHPEGGGLPGRQHFDPTDVPRLLANIWLLDVERDPLRFRYRLVGTALERFYGEHATGRYLGEVNSKYFDPAYFQHYALVVNEHAHHYRRGAPTFEPDRRIASRAHVERLLLPLARDGSTVDTILALTVVLDQAGAEI
ncbi:MAG: PAS domain-containing protein [Alphaproteobacteria bacterium]|nr:PAS domain-containing protein [Alphaproteobacteria bacterium]